MELPGCYSLESARAASGVRVLLLAAAGVRTLPVLQMRPLGWLSRVASMALWSLALIATRTSARVPSSHPSPRRYWYSPKRLLYC